MRLRQEYNGMWRAVLLLIVIVNLAFNYMSETFNFGHTIVEVSQKYNSLFTPANYAFAIWGVIYLSFLAYAIYQLLPSQRDEILFDRLAKPAILSQLLAMAWIISFRYDVIWLSMVLIVAMLITAISMHLVVRDAVLRDDYSNWISVPFSLLAGWLSVATIANASVLLISLDLGGAVSVQMTWTVVMLLVAGILGILVCFRCRDFIYPAVITWGCVAIFVEHLSDYPYLGAVALLGAAIPVIWIVTTILKRISYRHRILANKLSF